MSTLHDDYALVASNNTEYNDNRDRWEFLLNSYVGGDEYRRQGYLTRYQLETANEYQQRLNNTPLDNHCQSVISVYISYLFREKPERDFKEWEIYQDVEDFLDDCDYDGRSLDSFMKDVAVWSSVFGHSWILMTKPDIGATTLGDEQAAGLRPYVNLLTPLAVVDWTWSRSSTGAYELSYFKYIEEIVDKLTVVKEWTLTSIKTWHLDDQAKEAYLNEEVPNMLGVIPAVLAYNKRSIVKGIGVSDLADIADAQRLIYNYNSEIEQSIRLDGHPSLVVTPNTQFGSGAGAIIQMPENLDPGLRPYVLEHGGANVASIHASIAQLTDAIDRMANTGGVRAVQSQAMSGVALEVEFSLLNARLSEKADNLELCEEQLWKLFGLYQGREWNGEVEYPGSFNVRDQLREFQQLQIAKSAATDPRVLAYIDHEILECLGEDADLIMPEMVDPTTIPAVMPFEPHVMVDPETGTEYIARTMEEHLQYSALGYYHKED